MSAKRSTRASTRASNGDIPVADAANGTVKEEAKPKISPKTKAPKRVAPATNEAGFKIPEVPQTPKRRRKGDASNPVAPPPLTPTPSGVAALSSNSTNPRRNPAGTRKAAPHITNAPLQTPGGTRVVKYPSDLFDAHAPSSQDPNESGTTTENLLEKACAHLVKVDPNLQKVIDKHHCKIFSPEGLQEEVEPFTALASGIIAQQVSGAAANSIKAKFVALFPRPESLPEDAKYFPTPAQVITKDIATLRTAGLSQRKAEYIHGMAEKFVSGELSAQMLVEANDEEVLEKLIQVRGLGRWSVEMFACFGLKRMDIFSVGDLGVQRGMAAYVGKDVAKLKKGGKGKWKYMSEEDMLKHSEKFAPYRSLFMWYMWRIEDVNLEAIEGS